MNNQTLLDALTREGVLISVSCRYWRAAKKLQSADLGLDPTAFAPCPSGLSLPTSRSALRRTSRSGCVRHPAVRTDTALALLELTAACPPSCPS